MSAIEGIALFLCDGNEASETGHRQAIRQPRSVKRIVQPVGSICSDRAFWLFAPAALRRPATKQYLGNESTVLEADSDSRTLTERVTGFYLRSIRGPTCGHINSGFHLAISLRNTVISHHLADLVFGLQVLPARPISFLFLHQPRISPRAEK